VASNPSINEIGINIATPLVGPKPGRAPIIVPKIHPITASISVVVVKAIEKPSDKFANNSILKN
jgi:hypothetical protein